jgi:hypothetical protein
MHTLLMPRVGSFDGIAILVYFRDHPPPHFHARYQGSTVLIEIESLNVYSGSLPPAQSRATIAWASENQSLLRDAWARAQG